MMRETWVAYLRQKGIIARRVRVTFVTPAPATGWLVHSRPLTIGFRRGHFLILRILGDRIVVQCSYGHDQPQWTLIVPGWVFGRWPQDEMASETAHREGRS